MKCLYYITISLVIGLLCGCVTTSTNSAYMASHAYQQRDRAASTLFKGDEATLGGETIGAILDSRVEISPNTRLAIMNLNSRDMHGLWSEESRQNQQDDQNSLISYLLESDCLADVTLLPTLLTPDKKGVPQLREAAARLQAHLLLVYNSTYDSYAKYKYFAKDDVRSYCKVEVALLDVRTGIVPFTSISLQQYTVKETKDDMNVFEAAKRARMLAEAQGLKEIAGDLKMFLDTVPKSNGDN